MPYLKKEAPDEVIEALRRIETQADECWRALQILEAPANVAVWALLTGGIQVVEREQGARGSNTPHFSAMLKNLGLLLPIAVKWAIRHARPDAVPLRTDWTGNVEASVNQAIEVARRYSHFEVCFQAFHKDRYAAELLAPDLVRFSAPGGARDRQVSAYQKGHRPGEGRFAAKQAEPQPQAPAVEQECERVLRGCLQTGARSFAYGEPWNLWRALLPEYTERIKALTRRAESLSLGAYRLDEFNGFYVALLAVCAAHDFLCFRWGQLSGTYPIESAVMVRPVAEWIELLSRLSGVAREKSEAMLSDLTFSVSESVDLHVHPFVALDDAGRLALVPPFPLHSRHDENILRVCSQRRPQIYDVTSSEKEAEMLATVRELGGRYGANGPFALPAPVPDIDLMMADDASSTVVIAELKWIRKTLRPAEIPDRDADVLKGIDQLSAIRRFLSAAPDHLAAQGRLSRPLNEFRHLCYLLVARDHWRWVEPHEGIAIVEFDAFATVLGRSGNLHDTLSELLTYDWLPVEGQDFEIRYGRASVNGVSLESQIFYAREP